MLDTEQGALAITDILTRRSPGLAGETVGERTAVVGQQLLDLHRCLPASSDAENAPSSPC